MCDRQALEMRNRAIKEELAAMGAINHYVPKRVEMPSPFDGNLRRVEMKRKLTDVSSGVMDKREAREMLDFSNARIAKKREEFDTLAGSYTAISLSVSKDPGDYMHGSPKRFSERRSAVHAIWNSMSDLREEIWQLESSRASFLDGKRIVDGEEWMKLYDELNAELLDNRIQLLL